MNRNPAPGPIHIVPADEPSPEIRPAIRYALPFPTTPLIGREEELVTIAETLSGNEARVLTITGAPGIGKTRLAIEAARQAAGLFPDGVCYVPLSTVPSHDLLLPAIAQALWLRAVETKSLCESVGEFLSDRRMLLVLDNFEHLVEAACKIGELIDHSPVLKVLVTSRARLQIYSEHELPLSPLTLPEATPGRASFEEVERAEAVRLFVLRSRAANRRFRLTESNSAAVAEICIQLDGIPLALELAAARTRVFSPQAIAARLKQPGRRLHMLTGGARDLPARQQTLRRAIDWSYDLLSGGEKQLFGRLAVFGGGFSLEAAEEICGLDLVEGEGIDGSGEAVNLLDLLARLIGGSLIQTQEAGDGETRFLMLATIREYALERLQASAEAPEVARRHATYFTALAEQVDATLEGGTQQPTDWEMLDHLEMELGNLRAALEWVASDEPAESQLHRAEVGLRLAGALWLFWENRNHANEGSRWCERFLGAAEAGEISCLLAANKVLFVLGRLADYAGDRATARESFEKSLACWRDGGDAWGTSLACIALGQCAQSGGDYSSAEALFGESLILRKALEHDWGTAMALLSLSRLATGCQDNERAIKLLDEALLVARRSGNNWCLGQCLEEQASFLFAQSEPARALAALEESLSIALRLKDLPLIASCVTAATRLAIADGRFGQAATLLGAADFVIEQKEVGENCNGRLQLLTQVRAGMEEADFDRLWAEGRRMPLQDIPELLAGMRSLAGEPATVAARAEHKPAAWQELTPRELEVLQLLSQGLTNVEIGRQLVISPNTVSMHMRSIFSKLGVNSRSAATRYAFVHSLVRG